MPKISLFSLKEIVLIHGKLNSLVRVLKKGSKHFLLSLEALT